MQVTSTENKLSTLYEYVDDTEDYVEIQQDNRRNQLIKLDLLVCALPLPVEAGGPLGIPATLVRPEFGQLRTAWRQARAPDDLVTGRSGCSSTVRPLLRAD